MSDYTTEHAGAYADVLAAGASVTFTRRTETISETDGSITESTSTIAGAAMEKMSGESDLYLEAKLVRALAPLLFFVPATYGDEIQTGDECVWNGRTYFAKALRHLRPNGSVIATYAVVGA